MNSIHIDDTTLHLASWSLSIRSISFADRLKTLELFNDVGSKLSNDEISEIDALDAYTNKLLEKTTKLEA